MCSTPAFYIGPPGRKLYMMNNLSSPGFSEVMFWRSRKGSARAGVARLVFAV